MANVNAPLGFQYRRTLSGPASAVQVVRCLHAAGDGTGLFVGDLVTSPATHATDSVTGLPVVTQAGNSSIPYGVCIGVNPIVGVAIGSENLNRVYCPASTAMYVDVCTDPNAIYEIQSDGTVATTDVLKYANIATSPTGNTTTGNSGMQLHEASVTGTLSGAQMLILGQTQSVDNLVNSTNTRVEVKLVQMFQAQ